jgi:hypothetical protein
VTAADPALAATASETIDPIVVVMSGGSEVIATAAVRSVAGNVVTD